MLFGVSITNTLIIARGNPTLQAATKTVKKCHTTIAHELLDDYCSRKRRGIPPTVLTKRFKGSEHFPLLGDRKQHRCHYCSLQGITKDTIWYCKECDMYLCHKGHDTECFLVCQLNV